MNIDSTNRMVVSWQEEYCVRIDRIDEQHQALVAMTRRLQEAMLEGRARELQKLLIEQLIEYTRDHFAYEEGLMVASGYQGLSEHRKQHRTLTGQVVELRNQIDQGKPLSNPEVLRFLRHWITDHILQRDRDFGAAYHASQSATPPT